MRDFQTIDSFHVEDRAGQLARLLSVNSNLKRFDAVERFRDF